MSLNDYAEYVRSPQIANPIPSTNSHSFSVAWINKPNMLGTKPPNPQFQPANSPSYRLAPTWGAAPTQVGSYPNGLLQSMSGTFWD